MSKFTAYVQLQCLNTRRSLEALCKRRQSNYHVVQRSNYNRNPTIDRIIMDTRLLYNFINLQQLDIAHIYIYIYM